MFFLFSIFPKYVITKNKEGQLQMLKYVSLICGTESVYLLFAFFADIHIFTFFPFLSVVFVSLN